MSATMEEIGQSLLRGMVEHVATETPIEFMLEPPRREGQMVTIRLPLTVAEELFSILWQGLGKTQGDTVERTTVTADPVPDTSKLGLTERFSVERWYPGTQAHEIVRVLDELGVPVHSRPIPGFSRTQSVPGLGAVETLIAIHTEHESDGLREILAPLVEKGWGFGKGKLPLIGKKLRDAADTYRLDKELLAKHGK